MIAAVADREDAGHAAAVVGVDRRPRRSAPGATPSSSRPMPRVLGIGVAAGGVEHGVDVEPAGRAVEDARRHGALDRARRGSRAGARRPCPRARRRGLAQIDARSRAAAGRRAGSGVVSTPSAVAGCWRARRRCSRRRSPRAARALRQTLEHLVGGDRVLDARQLGQAGPRADRDQDAIGGDGLWPPASTASCRRSTRARARISWTPASRACRCRCRSAGRSRDRAPRIRALAVERRLADLPAIAARRLEVLGEMRRRSASASSGRSRGSRRCRRPGCPRRPRPWRRATPPAGRRRRRRSRRRSRTGRSAPRRPLRSLTISLQSSMAGLSPTMRRIQPSRTRAPPAAQRTGFSPICCRPWRSWSRPASYWCAMQA